ncbi:MAG TPA: phosphoenolpyruvate carboxylase [Thermoanaerobaculia bacterium]|nr:phosphoenolpyruvate carboxylase [Thermoanaerobaculia bacterium]
MRGGWAFGRARRRRGEAGAGRELEELLDGLEPATAAELTRAFSAYFSLVNLAERVHRIRRRRQHLADPDRDPPGSLRDVVRRLAADGVSPETMCRLVAGLRVEPVFTAHPTEAVRRTPLRQEQRVGEQGSEGTLIAAMPLSVACSNASSRRACAPVCVAGSRH